MIGNIAELAICNGLCLGEVDEASDVISQFLFDNRMIEIYVDRNPEESNSAKTRFNWDYCWSKSNRDRVICCSGVSDQFGFVFVNGGSSECIKIIGYY